MVPAQRGPGTVTEEEAGRMTATRGALRRTVFLLAGGAVAAAFATFGGALWAPFTGTEEVPLPWLLVGVVVAMMAGAGLLPGVRDVEVAGAQSLLGVAEHAVVVPEPMTWSHRWRTALWTFIHQLVGAATGLAVIGMGLLAGGLAVLASGRPRLGADGGLVVTRPGDAGGWLVLVLGLLVAVAVGVGLIVAAGRAAAWSAPLLLGPSGEDRLRQAEERLAREQEHVRLSRDLHDGVGHSLSAISLQAGAARRRLTSGALDEVRLAETLTVIEELAGGAVAELDHALAVLRRDGNGSGADASRERRPVGRIGDLDLRALEQLVTDHRRRGLEVAADLPDDEALASVPAVLSRTAYRICAEGLANVGKHGAGGPARLTVRVLADGGVGVELDNPFRAGGEDAEPPCDGHGLAGLRETVRLAGGRLSVGPRDDSWVLEAHLPGGGRRG